MRMEKRWEELFSMVMEGIGAHLLICWEMVMRKQAKNLQVFLKSIISKSPIELTHRNIWLFGVINAVSARHPSEH